MLLLSRKRNERIFIDCPDGTRIVITQIDHDSKKSRVAIDAPRTYVIHREEVQKRIDAAKEASSAAD